jgi:hypothetical protein
MQNGRSIVNNQLSGQVCSLQDFPATAHPCTTLSCILPQPSLASAFLQRSEQRGYYFFSAAVSVRLGCNLCKRFPTQPGSGKYILARKTFMLCSSAGLKTFIQNHDLKTMI